MLTINIHDAKAQLSRLVDRAAAGEVITIARAGTLAGVLRIPDDFDALLSPEILETFEA